MSEAKELADCLELRTGPLTGRRPTALPTGAKVVLVCGGRKYANGKHLDSILRAVAPTAVVHGGAPGADSLADGWARSRGVPVVRVDALWDFYGDSAGCRRNGWMLDLVRVHLVVAFPGGDGTADMVRRAKLRRIEVLQVEH